MRCSGFVVGFGLLVLARPAVADQYTGMVGVDHLARLLGSAPLPDPTQREYGVGGHPQSLAVAPGPPAGPLRGQCWRLVRPSDQIGARGARRSPADRGLAHRQTEHLAGAEPRAEVQANKRPVVAGELRPQARHYILKFSDPPYQVTVACRHHRSEPDHSAPPGRCLPHSPTHAVVAPSSQPVNKYAEPGHQLLLDTAPDLGLRGEYGRGGLAKRAVGLEPAVRPDRGQPLLASEERCRSPRRGHARCTVSHSRCRG